MTDVKVNSLAELEAVIKKPAPKKPTPPDDDEVFIEKVWNVLAEGCPAFDTFVLAIRDKTAIRDESAINFINELHGIVNYVRESIENSQTTREKYDNFTHIN
jgi:hypothetical protein